MFGMSRAGSSGPRLPFAFDLRAAAVLVDVIAEFEVPEVKAEAEAFVGRSRRTRPEGGILLPQ